MYRHFDNEMACAFVLPVAIEFLVHSLLYFTLVCLLLHSQWLCKLAQTLLLNLGRSSDATQTQNEAVVGVVNVVWQMASRANAEGFGVVKKLCGEVRCRAVGPPLDWTLS